MDTKKQYIGNHIQHDSLLGTEVTALKHYTRENISKGKETITAQPKLAFLKKMFDDNEGKKIIKSFFFQKKKDKTNNYYYGLLFEYITHEILSKHKNIINKIKNGLGAPSAQGETLMKILINENDYEVQKFITDKNFQNSRRNLLKEIIKRQTKKTSKLDLDKLNLDTLKNLSNIIFKNNILKEVFFIGGGDEEKVKKEIKDKLIRSILTEKEEKEIQQQQIKSKLEQDRINQKKGVREEMKKHDTENEELISKVKKEIVSKSEEETDERLVDKIIKDEDETHKMLIDDIFKKDEKHKQHTQRRVNERKKAKANPQEGEQEPEASEGGRRTRKRKGRKGRKSKKQRKGRKGRKKARKTKRKNGRKTKRKHSHKTKRKHSRKTKRKHSRKSKRNRTRKLKKHHHKGGDGDDNWDNSTSVYIPGNPLGKGNLTEPTIRLNSSHDRRIKRVPNVAPEDIREETYHRTIKVSETPKIEAARVLKI